MVKGKEREYIHGPSGRSFTDYDTYLVAVKAWDKHHYVTAYDREKSDRRVAERLLQDRLLKEQKGRDEKKERLKVQIRPLEEQQKDHIRKRNTYISLKNKEITSKIDEYESEIIRLQAAVKICKGALTSYKKEAFEEYEKNNPFKGKKDLKNLRSKLNKIR